VNAAFFPMLGIHPVAGRNFLAEEDQPGRDHVAILTDTLWRTQFHADPLLVGKTITLDGNAYVVAGILPASFRFPKNEQLGALVQFGKTTDVFKPIAFSKGGMESFGNFNFVVLGRMRAGWAYFASWPQLAKDFAQLSQAKLTMPVLSIGGEKSLGNQLAEQMNLVASDVTVVVLKDTGHWILEERPKETTDALVKFL